MHSDMMQAFIDFIVHFGVVAILLVVFAESGLLFGFIFPGDSLLFTAGYMVQQHILPIDIHFFALLLSLMAILGDSVGYAFGHKVGRKLFEHKNSRFFKKKYLVQAEKFYEKHGSLTVVLARFVPIVRTFAPIVAGASRMHYRTFIIFNIIGGVIWATLFTYLGFFAGKALTDAGINIEVAALIIIFLSVLPMIIHTLKQEHTHAALRQQVSVLLGKTRRKKE